MKKYLYYPNLEPPNTEWLKFAILYLEKFESIVPYDRQYLITDDYRKLSNETDLVEMYSPEYSQGERASIKAIEETEKFLIESDRRSTLFNRVNVARNWRDREKWNYQIYSEKFSSQWGDYCVENNLGMLNSNGLLLPKELAFLFMTNLAKEISHERNGSIITDNVDFDNYINFARIGNHGFPTRKKFMKGIISLLMPANISDISIDKLIKFRNANRDKIAAFNNQIDKIEESIGNGVTEKDFIESFNSIYSELTREIVLMGIGLASIPFSTYMLINNPEALSAEYTKEILGALGIGIGGTYSVHKALNGNREERLCKRYLTNLQRLR